MTRHCDGCGRYIDKEVDACPHCGHDLGSTDTAQPSKTREHVDHEPEHWRDYGRIGVKIALVQIVAAIILIPLNAAIQLLMRPIIYSIGTPGVLVVLGLVAVAIVVSLVAAGKVAHSLYGWT